jgi:uncharacterized protein (TIGR03435 family)
MMFSMSIRTALAALACCALQGQTADKPLSFDAASVKAAAPPTVTGRGAIMFRGPSGGPGTKDPGRINYPNMSLKNLLMNAFDVKNYQVSGPGWLDTERFDITATMPPETTKEQFRMMLQNLLVERFKMAVHRETKELPMYALVVGKGGPKMKESEPVAAADNTDAAPSPPPPLPSQPKIGPDGFPDIPPHAGGRGGIVMVMMPGRARMMGQRQTMPDLANRLSAQLSRPVTDATGLTAKYDFTLTFSTEGLSGAMGPMGPMGPVLAAAPPPGGGRGPDSVYVPEGDTPPTLFAALQAQLGLKLEPKKGNVEIIVVDHMEKTPTEN